MEEESFSQCAKAYPSRSAPSTSRSKCLLWALSANLFVNLELKQVSPVVFEGLLSMANLIGKEKGMVENCVSAIDALRYR